MARMVTQRTVTGTAGQRRTGERRGRVGFRLWRGGGPRVRKAAGDMRGTEMWVAEVTAEAKLADGEQCVLGRARETVEVRHPGRAEKK